MEEVRRALGILYEEFGQEKVHQAVLVRLSQIVDEYVADEQRRRYEEIKHSKD